MRFAISLCLLLMISQTSIAQDAARPPSPREIAESMIVPSGPLVARAALDPTPQAWRARRALATTWSDPASRHRFTRHTWGWPTFPGYGWYGGRCYGWAPYRGWYSWRAGW